MKRKDKIPANGDELPIRNSTAEFLIFAKDSGANTISVRFQDKMLWLTLQLIADLFDVDKSVVSRHLTNIFSQGELSPEGTVQNLQQFVRKVHDRSNANWNTTTLRRFPPKSRRQRQ